MRGKWFLNFLNKDPGVPTGNVLPVPRVLRGKGTGLTRGEQKCPAEEDNNE